MQKILPQSGLGRPLTAVWGRKEWREGGAAGSEIRDVGFENNEAERVVGWLAENVAEPAELRSKNKR